MELIDRQAAIDAPKKFIKDCNPDHYVGHQKFIECMENAEIGSFGNWQLSNGFNLGLKAAEVAIKELPSAEPERKTGKWIIYEISLFEGDDVKCSECGECGCAPYWDFCPNCGAKMEVDDAKRQLP